MRYTHPGSTSVTLARPSTPQSPIHSQNTSHTQDTEVSN